MIEHLKSGLSISTHVGCTMGCDYCVLSVVGEFTKGPQTDSSPEAIVDSLLSDNSLFVNGETTLFINNRTDPMLPSVEKSTYRLLELLDNNSIKSPVLLITKFSPIKQITPFFDRLHLMYVYSYSGYKNDFNYNQLFSDTKQICRLVPKASRFHYLRPIIPNVNDNIDNIREIFSHFETLGFNGSIITGFRVNRKNYSLLPQEMAYSTQHKLFSSDIYKALIEDKACNYHIFRHTSCAISYFMHTYNNLNYYNREGHCSIKCTNYGMCGTKPKIAKMAVEELMKRYLPAINDWHYEDEYELLVIKEEVTQEYVAFIRNVLGINVNAEKLSLSASERIITNR